jgi:hypothetical protein
VPLHGCGEATCGSTTAGVLHVPASMPPHRCCSSCTLLTACTQPGITGDDGLERSNVRSRRADGAAGVWQILELSAPRLGSRLRCVACEACLGADLSSMLLGPILGPDRVLWRNPCVRELVCTLSNGAACLRQIERTCVLDSVVVSCSRQQWYDTSWNTCSMSRIGDWSEVDRLICYLLTITIPFQSSVMSTTAK